MHCSFKSKSKIPFSLTKYGIILPNRFSYTLGVALHILSSKLFFREGFNNPNIKGNLKHGILLLAIFFSLAIEILNIQKNKPPIKDGDRYDILKRIMIDIKGNHYLRDDAGCS